MMDPCPNRIKQRLVSSQASALAGVAHCAAILLVCIFRTVS